LYGDPLQAVFADAWVGSFESLILKGFSDQLMVRKEANIHVDYKPALSMFVVVNSCQCGADEKDWYLQKNSIVGQNLLHILDIFSVTTSEWQRLAGLLKNKPGTQQIASIRTLSDSMLRL